MTEVTVSMAQHVTKIFLKVLYASVPMDMLVIDAVSAHQVKQMLCKTYAFLQAQGEKKTEREIKLSESLANMLYSGMSWNITFKVRSTTQLVSQRSCSTYICIKIDNKIDGRCHNNNDTYSYVGGVIITTTHTRTLEVS